MTPPPSPNHTGADAPTHRNDEPDFLDQPASLLALPENIRTKAIEAYLHRRSKPVLVQTPVIESYFKTSTSILDFDKVFPLGTIAKRWSKGIPIYPTSRHSVGRIRDHVSSTKTIVIEKLLEANIIVKAPKKRSSFLSNFFLVQKANNKVRPIMDYSHLGNHLKSPHFVLPSVYQIIRNKFKNFTNLFYIKLDLRAAFYNVPLKESSRYITTFVYNSIRYQMTKLPMGLSISPFVMQRFSNAIVAKYKDMCTFAWAHIDDMLFAHSSPNELKKIATALVKDLSAISWKISWDKSVLIPSRGITYLGAHWGQHAISRKAEVTTRKFRLEPGRRVCWV